MFNIIDDNVVENQKNQCFDDNNYVYLVIDLKLESIKIQKNDVDKFLVNIWLVIF